MRRNSAGERTSMAQLRFTALLFCLFLVSCSKISSAQRPFSLVNQCSFTVWPGTLSNAGMAVLFQGGTTLAPGATFKFTAPAAWAGRVWGRAGCSFASSGTGVCSTGDCGRGLYCNGAGGIPPATLAEFTLDGYGSQDFYDVSLVDGYNLPLSITLTGGTSANGVCGSPGCVTDLNGSCPPELQEVVNGAVVACKSACEAFASDNYCCAGSYNTPQTCVATNYSKIFKDACPTAYSYAYDDLSSTFTCSNPSAYTITFCPNGISMGSPTPGSMQSPPPPAALLTPPPPLTQTPPTAAPPPPSTGITPPPPPTAGPTPPPPPPPPSIGTAPPLPPTAALIPPPPPSTGLTPPPPSTAGLVSPPPPNTGTAPPPTAGLIPPPPPNALLIPPLPPVNQQGQMGPYSEVSPAEGPIEGDYGSSSAAGSSCPFWWEQHAFVSLVTTTTIYYSFHYQAAMRPDRP